MVTVTIALTINYFSLDLAGVSTSFQYCILPNKLTLCCSFFCKARIKLAPKYYCLKRWKKIEKLIIKIFFAVNIYHLKEDEDVI